MPAATQWLEFWRGSEIHAQDSKDMAPYREEMSQIERREHRSLGPAPRPQKRNKMELDGDGGDR
jgi:hypothetical protein